MAAIPATSYWFRVETIEPGRLHLYRYRIDGEWGPGGDVAGYNCQSYELPGVRPGTMSERRVVSSWVYPGATTEYWLYANHGLDEVRGAPLIVWHDGEVCLQPWGSLCVPDASRHR